MRWYGLGFAGGDLVPPTPPGWHRVVATASGSCAVRTHSMLATASRDHGVFVPAGETFALHVGSHVDLRILYLHEASYTGAFASRPVAITALLRALTERLTARGALDARDERDAHLIAVICDEVAGLANGAFATALPRDPRAVRAVEAITSNAAGGTIEISALASAAGTSRRTLERLFRAETGLGLARWSRRARLVGAHRMLSAGASVTDAAFEAGYASPSAFITAFRRTFGTTPGRITSLPRETTARSD